MIVLKHRTVFPEKTYYKAKSICGCEFVFINTEIKNLTQQINKLDGSTEIVFKTGVSCPECPEVINSANFVPITKDEYMEYMGEVFEI